MPEEKEENKKEITDNPALLERIDKLEKEIELLKNHQHLEKDGSKELSGETTINAKAIKIHGAGARVQDYVFLPFDIFDASESEKPKRATSIGICVTGDKEESNEQINSILVAGKVLSTEEEKELTPSNKTDFEKSNQAQLLLIHSPQHSGAVSGPSTFPPFAFLCARRTPIVENQTGTIITGGATLTDSSANFITNQLASSIISIFLSGSLVETQKISSNTANVITIDGTWEADGGNYDYEILTPVFLGSASAPFTRLYVGDDIRLGLGASGGTQVQYIKWGIGSPEGIVTANPGSLYLNRSGGAGTTLYIKQSGVQTNTGWVGK